MLRGRTCRLLEDWNYDAMFVSGCSRGINEILAVLGCGLVVSYRRFGTNKLSRLQVKGSERTDRNNLSLPTCPETSVTTNIRCVTSQKNDDLGDYDVYKP